jgi:patatin-like phospholipase/acyl hydrolase
LEGDHPKRILTLDGGGIKGALTLGILERLESRLAARLLAAGKIARLSDFRLCQYFDLIGGTSTGAIIAAALARGATAAEVKAKYLALGMDVFRSSWHSALTKPCRLFLEGYRFDARALERHLRAFFGEQLTLGGESLQTGLCVVAKRADTRSTWPMINHPRAKYYDVNSPLILWRLIRASSAAPTFFRPQILPTGGLDSSGKKDKGAFIDGAVSMANNPSLQCFLAAVLQGFPFHWQTGADRLLIVSVGTGAAHFKLERKRVRQWNVVELAQEIPSLVMDDAQWQNQLLMQSFSKSPTNMEIDGEVGDCSGDLIGGRELFHYVRLDSPLQEDKLEALASGSKGTKWEQILAKLPPAASLRDISAAQNVKSLAAIGEAEAARSIPEDATAFARLIPERFDTVIPSEAPTS